MAMIHGDCLEILPKLPESCIDSIVTDPPYGLSFMGKNWDHGIPGVEFWKEALRVIKPGGHMLAFGGTRTHHRLMVAIEDAGWEIRDCLMWVYGSGFPKSLNIGKAIDKEAGAEREVIGFDPIAAAKANKRASGEMNSRYRNSTAANDNGATITAPATDAAKTWDGWGTALKPAYEPIILCRKPISEKTIAANVLRWGTGALNIDGCRIGTSADMNPNDFDDTKRKSPKYDGRDFNNGKIGIQRNRTGTVPNGRFPANLLHDGSDEVLEGFPIQNVNRKERTGKRGGCGFGMFDDDKSANTVGSWPSDSGGSAARFYYCAKASKSDRGENNRHPCVKPTSLLRYLCRLITPPNGYVLDIFCGSGSTGKAALQEGFKFVGIEKEKDYVEIAKQRIAA